MEKTPAKPQVSLNFLDYMFFFVNKNPWNIWLSSSQPHLDFVHDCGLMLGVETLGVSGGYESWFAKMKKLGAPSWKFTSRSLDQLSRSKNKCSEVCSIIMISAPEGFILRWHLLELTDQVLVQKQFRFWI